MRDNSRTLNSIRNGTVAFAMQICTIILGFWKRKAFLEYLGAELMGLNTTAASLLEFLNLAELGIVSAIAFTLYKPLYDARQICEGDHIDKSDSPIQKVREIIALQGWMYKWVACAIMAGSLVLSFFFPLIFAKSELPIGYAYITFGVLLYGSMLSYFVNYKAILLSADQKNYKIQLCTQSISIIFSIITIIAVTCMQNPYIWWAGLQVLSATVSAVALSYLVNNEYPYIKEKVAEKGKLRKKYPDVVSKVKQLFVHKIGGFIFTQFNPIVIYAFASLSSVTLYSNYNMLASSVGHMLFIIFNSMKASIGNLVADSDKEHELKVFRELFSLRFFCVGVICICLWLLSDCFIQVWLGSEYLLDKTTLALIVLSFFLLRNRNTVDSFLDAHGAFYDVWVPYVEGGIYVGASILLGSIYGLNGVLSGCIISQLTLTYTWKPYLLFRRTLDVSVRQYYVMLLKHIVMFAISLALCCGVADWLLILRPESGFGHFFIYAALVGVSAAGILGMLLAVSEKGFRALIHRILTIR